MKTFILIIAMLILPVLVVDGILRIGSSLQAPVHLTGNLLTHSDNGSVVEFNLPLLLLQILVILIAARLLGFVFRKIHQPQVMGEMIAGILLGSTLLGTVSPAVSSYLFPGDSLTALNALSQIGLVLFMFMVGLELDPQSIKRSGKTALLVSHASIIFPFFLGVLLALILYPRFSANGVPFTHFALFIGTSLSITAFPILARILSERKLINFPIGAITLSSAAVNDVTGWLLLAIVVLLVRSDGTVSQFGWTIIGLLLFIFLMLFVVKRFLKIFVDYFERQGGITHNSLALTLLLVLLSAWITEMLGIHALFGAFLAGVIMPKNNAYIHALTEKINDTAVVLLLPLFFALTGLHTSLNMINDPQSWIFAGLIILTAITGKMGGAALAARVSGLSWRDAGAVGILMNTRGLMELVLLNIGLEIGVISSSIFAMLVLMTLVTTFMTSPLIEWIYFKRFIPGVYREGLPLNSIKSLGNDFVDADAVISVKLE